MSDVDIEKKALEPAEYENDGERIKNRSAADTIALLKYAQKSRRSTKKAFGGLGIVRISTPGADE
ncbi:MAG: hypothetical protein IKD29_03555 [Lentisphaeria bacterium]|nr:hypothetical protein [Lentisphaeria bacterium]